MLPIVWVIIVAVVAFVIGAVIFWFVSKNHNKKVYDAKDKEAKEAIGFQAHAQERPAQQDDDHAPQEEAGALEFVPLEEEGERPPQADDEREASQEQQLRGGRAVRQVRVGTLAPCPRVRGQARSRTGWGAEGSGG